MTVYLSAIKYGATAVAGAFAMWLWHSAVVSDIEASAASRDLLHAIELQSAQVRAQKEVARIEQYHYEKTQRAIAAIPEPKRVYVRANCPSVPAADLPGVDTGAGAELDAAGRSVVLQLRRGIERVQGKLAACQELLKQPASQHTNPAPS